ncbi:dimethyladenosine transferase(S-adenosylmethionine-6-N', N'-adenosyl(rRNA)dimethyltransferase) (16S rRNA dimethylase) (high levelkasugamycin resistance protein ksgA) (kasugamycindimethyltransferase) [Metamycoplasma arthritidis]|uniref:Ribosomal RNA small subunit methyltransferase A n=1 Tax=Metamycoplasma arthritidis (strain 158L3-1) TaxID=243272 RepID=RSMA_META1|nr:16S rRNA (adenine(1518)-N(6)/adenine(1519)-N(6))-dimethyltransferase RsmA [Metamycoplasma arthritidis]B3PLS2.1 RecName: Full=Ribosomal RNA small subunit methyltransferase A; AltName: Full=16S rRNA (adenine(1518)-N(6)/adenine(1519)-N(6))-dimethyltransferase; AltName: Full=16S rRNA dimethyladenosine transferase; AltName: Full=16S rRNA dimethylase; AltName: Full=S-adenosylmethionine-6-N', N'-adenosyl(rRNA) dimethyltransferase [Metamycoplasma arthritidis 158L3-1]ACF06974.1 dimethyladenosine transf
MEVIAKKRFGQNFLINKAIQKAIVDVACVDDENVIEIGPGLGALTDLIKELSKELIAYEIDNDLFKKLLVENQNSNVRFINEDFLNATFDEKKEWVVIGNIPYNITSEILFKLIENHSILKKATLMVQDEVANRLVAMPKTKEYSKLTVSVNFVGNVKKHFVVKASNFNPAPKVDSAIITIDFYKSLPYNLKKVLAFIKQIFAFKRKMLINNLVPQWPKADVIWAIEQIGHKQTTRAEELSLQEIMKLYEILVNSKSN